MSSSPRLTSQNPLILGHIVGHIVRHWDTKWNTTRHTYLGDKTQNMPTEKCQVAVPPHQNVDKPQYTRQRAPTEKELGKALENLNEIPGPRSTKDKYLEIWRAAVRRVVIHIY